MITNRVQETAQAIDRTVSHNSFKYNAQVLNEGMEFEIFYY